MSQPLSGEESNEDLTCVNYLRALSVDCVQAANSGHPGMPLGMAPAAYILFTEFLKFDPLKPNWFDRDRFVLSNGHGSALLYSLLHLSGYNLSMEDLKQFRQLHSKTPGHPERGVTDGVEVTTGPLGQGIANAVGMCIAEAHLRAKFCAKVVDHYTYVFCGDGCLMEGVGQEALSLAGHLGLEKLVIIYDDNRISIDGSTDLSYTEKKTEKYAALGFHCIVVPNGDSDLDSIRKALRSANTSRGKPTMIFLSTTIGYGSEMKGTAKVHGAPLGVEGVKKMKANFGLDPEKSFYVPENVLARFRQAGTRGCEKRTQWETREQDFSAADPSLGALFRSFVQGELPSGWEEALPVNASPVATRKASELCLSSLVPRIQNLLGGSADLTGSNLTQVASQTGFQKSSEHGRYLYYGVREHAMAAICNGIAAHGGLIPYCGTFLNFIGYALGAVRLSALAALGVIYVATHDSIALGEDGPTHQPVELPTVLRAMPNLHLFRPADQTETSACWALALKARTTPSVLCLTRQALPPLPGTHAAGVARGGYVVAQGVGFNKAMETAEKMENNNSNHNNHTNNRIVLLSTGSELHLCVKASEGLMAATPGLHVRVVSMPCMGLFAAQSREYRKGVLPEGVPVLAVEAWSSQSWGCYAHAVVGLDRWGESAPGEKCLATLGFTVESVVEKAKALVAYYGGSRPAPVGREFVEL